MDNYYTQRDLVLHSLFHPVKILVGLLVYRNQKQMLHSVGIGRYSTEQCKALREEIWFNLNKMLEESFRTAEPGEPFWCLGGSSSTEADAALFGFVSSVLLSPASVFT